MGALGVAAVALPLTLCGRESSSTNQDFGALTHGTSAPPQLRDDSGLGAANDEYSPFTELRAPQSVAIPPRSISPAELTSLLNEVHDSDSFMLILRALEASGQMEGLPDEQKASLQRHALRIDPFQIHIRMMRESRDPAELASRVPANGALLYQGQLEGSAVMVELDSPVSPSAVTMTVNDVTLTASLSGRTESGGIVFSNPALPADHPAAHFEVKVHASPRGLVLDFSWPDWPPYRMEVWKGAELPDDSPPSIMEEVERILNRS